MALGKAVKGAVDKVFKEKVEHAFKDQVKDSFRRGVRQGVDKDAIKSTIDKVKDVSDTVKKGTFKKGEGSWLLNYKEKAHKPIEFLPGTHHTVKKRFSVGIPLAIGAVGMASTIGKEIPGRNVKDMNADELSNTVNRTRSSKEGYKEFTGRRNPERFSEEEIREKNKENAVGLRTGNAAGDLVFALHNLKNGGI